MEITKLSKLTDEMHHILPSFLVLYSDIGHPCLCRLVER